MKGHVFLDQKGSVVPFMFHPKVVVCRGRHHQGCSLLMWPGILPTGCGRTLYIVYPGSLLPTYVEGVQSFTQVLTKHAIKQENSRKKLVSRALPWQSNWLHYWWISRGQGKIIKWDIWTILSTLLAKFWTKVGEEVWIAYDSRQLQRRGGCSSCLNLRNGIEPN